MYRILAVIPLLVVAQPAHARVLESLTDRCSTSVRIEPSLIFSQTHSGMVPGSQDPIRLHRTSPAGPPTFSAKRTVGLTSAHHFKWFCGPNAHNSGGTQEQSRCPPGTNALRARLGSDRLLRVECHSD
ncbi:MAG: hypothetical protein ABIT04_10955 [Novosphingobium sp.]